MLKHKVISQISFCGHGYRVALVETATDYVIAKGYRGHKECWEQGYYFPKFEGDLEARESATNAYINEISKEITFWL